MIQFISQIPAQLALANISDISKKTQLGRQTLYDQKKAIYDFFEVKTTLELLKYWQYQFRDLWEIKDENGVDRLGKIAEIDWSKQPSLALESQLNNYIKPPIDSEARKIGINPNTAHKLLLPIPLKRIHTPTWGRIMDFYDCNFGDLIKLTITIKEKKEED